MAFPLHTGGGKPEGSSSKFYFFTYILICLPPIFMTSSLSASNLPSNSKNFFPKSPNSKTIGQPPPSSEKVLEVFSRTKKIRSNTPREIPRKSEGKGIILPVPLLRRKKNGQEKERVFLTRQYPKS
ncbi:hypothetical protein AVEN_254951-1 [Araneus ventricosus]|uniref:Uncharacterized protein n=1 Tax=Araneus ventricosus TaxID=182803 RepID=A0A4Y2IAU0_ARAVE|nr:hypothetical protein AVEN_254951-1 [Araneus ventricosus]